MLSWLVKRFSADGEAECLDSAQSIRALVAEISGAPPDRAIRTLSERFGEIPRQELSPAQSCRAFRELDDFAQLPLSDLWEGLLVDTRGQSVADAAWHTLTTYYRKVHGGFWYCLNTYQDSRPLSESDRAEAMVLASRAMTALARYMLLLRMRYRTAPKEVWTHVNNLLAWVERRGDPLAPLEQYPGTGLNTTFERELLAALLIEVAPTGNLLPAQIHALDRLLRPYAAYYSISETYDEKARPFAYEPTKNESPRRWLKGLQLRPGIRFFGIGDAYLDLCNARDDAKTGRVIPKWIGRTQCSLDDYRGLLERLTAEWSQHPPRRQQRREQSPGEILVAHQWADIRRLVTFGELARRGQSLMYDTSNVHWMNNTSLRGRSEVFRDFTAEEIMLANLRSFELSLDKTATDLWTLADSSEDGLGATATATCAWLKVGMLVALRRADSIDWQLALVRRVNSTANHKLSVGMTKLAHAVHAARLRLGVGSRDYSKSTIGGGEPALEYDALLLQESANTLLLPIGVVDTTCKYTLHWNNREDIIKMEKSVDRGLNFERVEISGLQPSTRAA